MNNRTKELMLVVACLAIATLVYWSANQIPSSLLAKTNAGLVPKIIAVSLILLAILHLIFVLSANRTSKTPTSNTQTSASAIDERTQRNDGRIRIALLVSFMVVFVICLEFRLTEFWLLALGFVFLSVLAMSGISSRSILTAASIAAISVGATIVFFTKIFTVILP